MSATSRQRVAVVPSADRTVTVTAWKPAGAGTIDDVVVALEPLAGPVGDGAPTVPGPDEHAAANTRNSPATTPAG